VRWYTWIGLLAVIVVAVVLAARWRAAQVAAAAALAKGKAIQAGVISAALDPGELALDRAAVAAGLAG
jgi:hypothetical protein